VTDAPRRRRYLSRRVRLIAALVVVVVAAGVTVLAIRASADTSSQKTFSFTAASGAIANPERGFDDAIDDLLTDQNFSQSAADGIRLIHAYVRLDEFRSGPISDTALARLQTGFDALRADGMKVILRFAYNAGPYPNSQPDAPESVILSQLKQLGPILAKNDDIIAAVEAGFIGAWGEWHTSTNGLDTDPAAKKTILSAVLAAVPSNRDVLLRYPADIRAIDGPSPLKSSTMTSDEKSRVGNHQDCFLYGDASDGGTWSRDGSSVAADKSLIAGIGRYAMVGGETCNSTPPVSSNCTNALEQLSQMGFSYLNRDYEPNTLAKLKSEGCYDTIADKLGYRLELTRATLPAALASTSTSFAYTLKINNVGFASPVNERPAYLVVRGAGVVQKISINTDVRTWDPGVTNVAGTATLSAALKPGTYTVSLWLPDASHDLQSEPDYSIRLATQKVWNASTGENRLGTFSVPKN
jgi:hypothetical protein